ncbi:MAG: tRNA 4-thiouridine(8) synthase ThiI [Clostridia bacterium]|nr:tRNA 4-thiouridine(8) synthase ThiI [Clostridia bacterium]
MSNVVLIRYGELFLKGKNKKYFENVLLDNIKYNLKKFDCKVSKISGRYLVEGYDVENEESIIAQLQKIFGIHSVSPAILIESSKSAIYSHFRNLDLSLYHTFRVTVNRADKTFPVTSYDMQRELGAEVLMHNKHLKVNLANPEIELQVDIREGGYTFIFDKIIPCSNGMPVGTAGTGLLLLSGGIDSPVAGYMMAKRGMKLAAIHFHSYPYTSEQAKQKVVELAKIVSEYSGSIKLHIVTFTKIQEAIHKKCKPDYMITIMRRIMMRIAESIAMQNGYKCLITGESLGQVASQTVESITVTNNVITTLPVLRPLIGMDKEEITVISKKINAFETSILPYEDCCTVFLPEHPVIKPTVKSACHQEKFLDIQALIDEALSNAEIIE